MTCLGVFPAYGAGQFVIPDEGIMTREGFAHVFSVYAPGERDLSLEVLRAQIDTAIPGLPPEAKA